MHLYHNFRRQTIYKNCVNNVQTYNMRLPILNDSIIYYRKSSWRSRVAKNPVRHDRCALSSALFYRTPVFFVSPMHYILTDGKEHAVPDTCREYVWNRMHRYTLKEESIPKQKNRYDIIYYNIFLIKYAVERRCV